MAVEDSENDADLLRRALRVAGFANPLKILPNGEEAKNYLAGKNHFRDRQLFPLPIAILVDLKMPRMNGFQLLEWMKTRPELHLVWKVVVTNSAEARDIDRAYELGASFFLTKPGKLEDLTKMMKSVMEWLRLNQYQGQREAGLERETV